MPTSASDRRHRRRGAFELFIVSDGLDSLYERRRASAATFVHIIFAVADAHVDMDRLFDQSLAGRACLIEAAPTGELVLWRKSGH